ncbi:2-dehydropantoate 2-reductase [Pantoea sp. Aalb]|uniref:2-dehydropantoate 2-reductase n=1 Tax=Pantoea sp. Aalb TaxID=2576762 RepID=UPI001325801A|nr:2-dehydropantoate 2-reductase [Pantoea sp. Aalb]MXP67582.1 2-dehydropantoate 2-reductase [Pantoea sp. Aalb]
MKVTVLGCGAIGQIWLSSLARQGHEVQGWLRVPQQYCSVNVIDIQGCMNNYNFIANDPIFLADSQLLLVTLKAQQVFLAVKNLTNFLPTYVPILLLNNGMGILEELKDLPHPILCGITTHTAIHDGRLIKHTVKGITHIGPTNRKSASMSNIADILHQSLSDVAWHDNITSTCWRNLAINCIINPLTVQYNCKNGELRTYSTQIINLCEEIVRVMEREGQHIAIDNLHDIVYDILEKTATNISLMLQEVREQRQTEIDYITGYLLRRARAHGIKLPANSRLYDLIKQKELQYNYYQIIDYNLPKTWS